MKGFRILVVALVVMGGASAVAGAAPGRESEARVTVVYDDVATEIAGARVDGAELWVTTEDLTRATRFELKPQGVCRDELCFPLPKERRGEFVREEGGKRWFHLTEFARLVRQPFATNAEDKALAAGGEEKEFPQGLKPGESGVVMSGLKPRPPKEENGRSLTPANGAGVRDDNHGEANGQSTSVWYFGLRGDQREGLASLKAPNFTLPDMAGKMHSLADFAAGGSRRGKKVLLVTWASW